MIILKMRASFGKLNGELTLQEGMNLLCLPNESGKSTWSAFLLAMLYGFDTREQPNKANNGLPERERYKPWDGRAMEGSIELIHDGRRITIERRTKGRIPMGAFEAYDTVSGTPIPELTAENCGRVLCGVERSVFERTAFIRQLGLSVTADPTLEKRMSTLVTTGEEGKSASQLKKELHEMMLKLARPSSGRIGKCSDQIEQLTNQLDTLHEMQKQAMHLRSQVDAAQAELARLDALCRRIDTAKSAKQLAVVEESRAQYAKQEQLCLRLKAQLAALPSHEELQALSRKLDFAADRLHTAQMEYAFLPDAPQKPQPPSCFADLTLSQAEEKQQEDQARYERLQHIEPPKKNALIACLLLTLLCAGLCFISVPLGISAAALGIALCIVCGIRYTRQKTKAHEAKHQAALLLERYGVEDIEQSAALLESFTSQMHRYEEEAACHSSEEKQLKSRLNAAQKTLDELMQQVRSFAPSCSDEAQCKEALRAALQIHTQHLSEQRALDLQRAQLSSLQQLYGNAKSICVDEEALQLDAEKIAYERNAAAEHLAALQKRLSEQNGRIEATADATMLSAQLERCMAQKAADEETVRILTLAQEALNKADETLRSRFSPQITAEAGSILADLTGKKYSTMLLKPDMSLSIREDSGIVTHPAAAMSCGTADQMYLALRLAMVRRLLSPQVPIVLDDALVNFDDVRTRYALSLLHEEAKNRQIILFTCKEIPYVL